jgi:hypothetical protein
LVGFVLVAALAVSGCTKADETKPSPSVGGSTSTEAPEVLKGTYGWGAYGVTATLKPGDETWSLEIENDSGKKIGAPGIYALASDDGHRVDSTVEGAKSLADGGSATLDVTWPPDFDEKNVGMVMLLIGGDLYGGFERGR